TEEETPALDRRSEDLVNRDYEIAHEAHAWRCSGDRRFLGRDKKVQQDQSERGDHRRAEGDRHIRPPASESHPMLPERQDKHGGKQKTDGDMRKDAKPERNNEGNEHATGGRISKDVQE